MTYVRTNTAPTFGMRAQAIWPTNRNLGTYLRASFPLPTTSLSGPIARLGSMFYDGPYPNYPQPEQSRTRDTAVQLSGEYVPPGPPPRAAFEQGAVTYHINPQTGKYQFYSTDLLPRGLWQQNTFQHSVRPALSSLGVPVQSRGQQLVQIGGRTAVVKTTPSCRGTCGKCKCRGRCKVNGLGADIVLPGGKTIYAISPDGTVIQWSDGSVTDTTTGVTVDASGNTVSGNAVSQTASALQQVATALNPSRPIVPVQQPSGFFTGSTNIAGAQIPNALLAIGGLLLVGGAVGGGRRR